MIEQLSPIEPRFLIPEYWDGHSKNDSCGSKIARLPLANDWYVDSFGRKVLRDFLTLSDKELLLQFNKGDIFNGAQFPEGTIIKVDREELFPGQKPFYWRVALWGVTCGYEVKNTKKLAVSLYLHIPTILNPNLVGCTQITDGEIQVGKTYHEKEKNIFGKTDKLFRINKIELYEIGKGKKLPKKVESRLTSLDLQPQT